MIIYNCVRLMSLESFQMAGMLAEEEFEDCFITSRTSAGVKGWKLRLRWLWRRSFRINFLEKELEVWRETEVNCFVKESAI